MVGRVLVPSQAHGELHVKGVTLQVRLEAMIVSGFSCPESEIRCMENLFQDTGRLLRPKHLRLWSTGSELQRSCNSEH